MSLKAVHLIFVGAFSGLGFVCAAMKLKEYFSPRGTVGDLFFGIGSIAVGIAVIIYGKQFLKKLKHISYL